MFDGIKKIIRKYNPFYKKKGARDTVWDIPIVSSIFSIGSGKLSENKTKTLYSGWVYACVVARSQEVAKVNLNLKRRTSNGLEPVEEHEVLDTLFGVNEQMGKSDLWDLSSQHLDLYGEAFWKLDKSGGVPRRLIPLKPSNMTEQKDNDGIITSWRREWSVDGNRKSETLDPDQIVHIKDINPFDWSRGYSIVRALVKWIEIELSATEWNRSFFENNAIPPALFEAPEEMGKKQKKRFLESWEEKHKGMDKVHKLGLLPSGVKVKKLSEGLKDMDFSKLDERYQNKILSGFRVPKAILGVTNNVKANAEEAHKIFMQRSIEPRMEKIVNTLNEFLIPMFGDDLVLTFESPVPEDKDAIFNRTATALGDGQHPAWISPNEARENTGYEQVEGADDIPQPITLSNNPLGETKHIKGTGKKKKVDIKESRYARNFKLRRDRGLVLTEDAAENIAESVKGIIESADPDEIIHKGFIERVEPFVDKMESGLQTIARVMEKDTIENLDELMEENKSLENIKAKDILRDDDQRLDAFVKVADPIYNEVVKQEGSNILDDLGIAREFEITEELSAEIDEKISKLSASYGKTAREKINGVIQEGLEKGWSIQEVRFELREQVFNDLRSRKARVVADTETFRAANLGIRKGYEQSNVVKTLRWHTAGDDRVCQFCNPMNGKTVSVESGEPFHEQGTEFTGNDGGTLNLDYDEVSAPPLHPSCRCFTRPAEISID